MGAGGSKTLAWGFAMAPHRLRALVDILKSFINALADERSFLHFYGWTICKKGQH